MNMIVSLKRRWKWGLGLVVLLSACSPAKKQNNETPSVTEVASLQELALPDVPTMLTAPEERATYILTHFWDSLNTGDTLTCHNSDFMEQNIVNFLSLFPHADGKARAEGMGTMLRIVATDSVTFRLVTNVVERYLDDPNSPMRCEEYYITYLEELLRLSHLSEAERLRPTHRLELARKNRPGMMATDFSYTARNGKRCRLHTTTTTARWLLLVFYDPACDHCTEILQSLSESPTIGRCIADKKLAVLAIYTEGDRDLWNRTKNEMPEAWQVGIDTDSIVARELYDIPAMPVLYLLSSDKTVLLKDAAIAEIENELSLIHL